MVDQLVWTGSRSDGEITALAAAAVANDRPSYIQTFASTSPSAGNGVVTAGAAYLAYVGRPGGLVINNFRLSVNANAGNVDIAALTLNADLTYTLIGSTGSKAVGATGIVTFAAASQIVVPHGVDLVLSVVGDNAALSLLRLTAASASAAAVSRQLQIAAGTNIPIPASIAASPGNTTYLPYIWAGA